MQYCQISQEGNQTVKFGQLIEYNIRKCDGENLVGKHKKSSGKNQN